LHRIPRTEQRQRATNSGSNGDTQADGVHGGQTSIGPGFAGGHEGELRDAVELAGLDPIQHFGWINQGGSSKVDRQVGCPFFGDRSNAGLTS
jgi:hypothetical protein